MKWCLTIDGLYNQLLLIYPFPIPSQYSYVSHYNGYSPTTSSRWSFNKRKAVTLWRFPGFLTNLLLVARKTSEPAPLRNWKFSGNIIIIIIIAAFKIICHLISFFFFHDQKRHTFEQKSNQQGMDCFCYFRCACLHPMYAVHLLEKKK